MGGAGMSLRLWLGSYLLADVGAFGKQMWRPGLEEDRASWLEWDPSHSGTRGPRTE